MKDVRFLLVNMAFIGFLGAMHPSASEQLRTTADSFRQPQLENISSGQASVLPGLSVRRNVFQDIRQTLSVLPSQAFVRIHPSISPTLLQRHIADDVLGRIAEYQDPIVIRGLPSLILAKLQKIYRRDIKASQLEYRRPISLKITWGRTEDVAQLLKGIVDGMPGIKRINRSGMSKRIVKIEARKIGLAVLPKSIESFTKLQALYLDNNQLSALPASFGGLHSLEILDLDNNQLSALPDSFGGLHSLEILYLGNNQLSALPASFGGLHSLRVLDLRNNLIDV